MKEIAAKYFFLSFFLLSANSKMFSQTCDSKYVSLSYRDTTFQSFSKAFFTPNNEIFVTGAMTDYNEAGYIAKFSKNGIPL